MTVFQIIHSPNAPGPGPAQRPNQTGEVAMPYIIETRYDHEPAARRLEAAGYVGEAFQLRHSVPTRTAVATLDEARHDAADIIESALGDRVAAAQRVLDIHELTPEISDTYSGLLHACHAVTESGGTVGPLPDGTVLEVRQVEWSDLDANTGVLAASPFPNFEARNRILAAFNAA